MSKRRSSIRTVVVLSDLHCGSTVGLLPPGFRTFEDNLIEQNAIQRWLWECWTDMTDQWLTKVVGDDSFALVVNGDATEGAHHRDKQIVSPETKDHVEAAHQVLAPLCRKADRIFITEGTECHTSNNEATLAKILGAQRDPDTNKAAWPQLRLTVAGCRCVFRHHITTAIRTYLEATALGIHLNQEQLEAAKNGEQMPRVLCCAHRHRYGQFIDASGLCLVTPPWQALTRYGHKVVPAARTRPGAVVLDWRERDDGDLPYVHAVTYRAPEATGFTL